MCLKNFTHDKKNAFVFILCMYVAKIMHAKYLNTLNNLYKGHGNKL